MTDVKPPYAVATDRAPSAVGPYAQGVVACNLLFISGQVPVDPDTGKWVEGDIADRTRRVIANIEAIAQAAGSDLSHVVKTTIFLTDIADFAAVNAAYAECFGSTLPARSTVQVAALPKGADIEMEAVVSMGR